MSTPSFTFNQLSLELILDGLAHIGVRVDSGLTPLNSYENRVYQFMAEDRQRYVVKFYRPQRWSRDAILEEHALMAELAANDIAVAAALDIDGQTLHDHQNYSFALFTSMGGRNYEMDNLQQLEAMGRCLARVHQISQQATFIHRPSIGLEEYVNQPQAILSQSPLIPVNLRKKVLSALDDLIIEIKQYWSEDIAMIKLHGDCHPGNILWRDGPLLVDFDDARNGPAIQDLWMLLHGERQEKLLQLDILLEGYEEFNHFDQRQLALIEPLRAMRMIYFLAWVSKRWQDPAFPKNFPWMLDEDFWQRQQLLFAEQVKALQAPPLQLMPIY